jgi:flagellar basal-body rod protein FlgB
MRLIAILLAYLPINFALASDSFDDFYKHLRYLSERDKLLSQNIANSDTPKYQPKELKKNFREDSVPVYKTNPLHMDLSESSKEFALVKGDISEIKPNGNSVNLDNELYKKGENAMKLNEAINVYNKSKSMLNTAIMGPGK